MGRLRVATHRLASSFTKRLSHDNETTVGASNSVPLSSKVAEGEYSSELTVEVQTAEEHDAVDTSRIVRDALPIPLLGFSSVSDEELVAVCQPSETRPDKLPSSNKTRESFEW